MRLPGTLLSTLTACRLDHGFRLAGETIVISVDCLFTECQEARGLILVSAMNISPQHVPAQCSPRLPVHSCTLPPNPTGLLRPPPSGMMAMAL